MSCWLWGCHVDVTPPRRSHASRERPVEDGEGVGDAIGLSLPSKMQAARVESVEGKDHASHTVQSP